MTKAKNNMQKKQDKTPVRSALGQAQIRKWY